MHRLRAIATCSRQATDDDVDYPDYMIKARNILMYTTISFTYFTINTLLLSRVRGKYCQLQCY